MAREIVKAKLDVIFKMIFTDKENINLLTSFLADILDIPADSITDITIENSEIAPDEIDQKFTRLDLNMTTNRGLINVEIQISNNGDFPERGLYYWARRYGRQLKKGDSYSDIQPTISIYIVDFKMFDTDSFYSFYTMADLEHNKILTDKCAMYFFELPKLDKDYDPKNRRKLWMQLINAESEVELDMLDKTQVPEIQNGVKVIYDLSADTLIREKARRREERLLEERSALSYARRQGIAEGRADLLAALRAMGIDEETLKKAAEQAS